jgi:predicted short-subunit dehydrogenase-like oxidoreductase (DUF2520 family)
MVGFIVVGQGRAGRSMAAALASRGWRHDDLIGRDDDLAGLAGRTDVVVLAVPDDQIAVVAAAIEPGDGAMIHLSGAKGLDVLGSHRRRGSVHPLMSLPDPETGARRLTGGGVFAVAGDPIARTMVETLGGRPIEVDDHQRPLYHAAAAVAANHLVALCAQVARLATATGVPVDAYWDLMDTTLDNVRRSGPLSSLTGPAARGDDTTIALHLDALPPSERQLYLALATEAARLAGKTLRSLADTTSTDTTSRGDADK